MPFRIDEARLERDGRAAGVTVATYTMRAMERWRSTLTDYDEVMIMIAVIAISAARLLRGELPERYRSLDTPIDPAMLAKVNIASIAHATGLNRETARRKVNDLIERTLLVRDGRGTVAFRPGLVQEEWIRGQVRGQIAEIAAAATQLERIGVLVQD